MKLKVQTLMMAGAKVDPTQPKNMESLRVELMKEKTNWFPIFNGDKQAGSLKIKT